MDFRPVHGAPYLLYLKDRGGAYEPLVIDGVIGTLLIKDGNVQGCFGEDIPLDEITY